MTIVDFSNVHTFINKAYHPYLEDFRRFQVFKGGAGAGKSVFITQKIIYNIIDKLGYNGIILRKIKAENHNTTFPEVKKCINSFGLENLFKINSAKGQEEIVCLLNKNKIVFHGLDDVNKIKSITFDTGDLIWIWLEEADETTEEDLIQLNIRLRGLSDIPKHIMLSFNPIDEDHWIKKRFFDNRLESNKGYICETTYHDNEYLSQEDVEELEKLKDIDYYYYMVYVLNEWGRRTGTSVFHNLEIHDFEINEWDYDMRVFGQDFGFNHANTLISIGFKDGELYIFREYYYKRKTNTEFIEAVEAEVAAENFYKDINITADSANPGDIQEWNNHGWTVDGAKKGKDSLKIGINYLKKVPKIHILKGKCPNSVREFSRFKYKQLKDGTILDEYVEVDDDCIAGVRYACEDLFLGGDMKPVFTKGLY